MGCQNTDEMATNSDWRETLKSEKNFQKRFKNQVEKHSVQDRQFPRIYPEFMENLPKKLLSLPELYQEFTHNLLRIYTEFTQKYCSHKQKSVLIQKENNNKNNKAIFKTSQWKRFEKRFKNSQKKKRTKIDLRIK